mmetsp:Transcript_95606/g.169777  ORF Transcript_95606/g.169777 Transcript_95606/m.169777 type:complete len:237 (-) Transcript_95606:70-780(-)|eukprot:CAMPEP_0197657456 /NCGR_PEP_ID=MMETSP1338-20131121/44637_1 /TAXON_ID=43686 ORGANISM="Pelagodinium beii, Strain RCC1491" /NCGR_SAMPLE_ID=MMETSP1338 /ASSEMBLY_ACC=CAM_ASM_000754 /LENGTH=236 /DNA_ID=CAMNT_0043233825 /DNA_START=63 /DNA_END=773 /DNA_ORIENTATION=+
MSSKPVLEEDEFKDRDSQGLQPLTEKTPTEEAETSKYQKMLLVMMPLIGQVICWSLYLFCSKVLGHKEIYDKKFEVIHEWQLGYVFLAVWMISYARAAAICQANGARAPARVDRPDQHVYKIMAASGSLKDSPYVMMATTGPQGRFNRAQRGVFNTDEAMPAMLANVILAGSVFGPLVPCVCLLIAYGRVTFTVKYKESVSSRGAGFLPAMIGEKILEGLVLLCAIKTVFYGRIPF